MYAGKPIIGIMGGIGSGKSFVAKLFSEMGCLVIDSDEQVRQAYQTDPVRRQLHQWWGDKAFHADGQVNKAFIAEKIFSDPAQKLQLERFLHPLVTAQREKRMRESANDLRIKAYVWDTPLLAETGLDRQCDALVFVEAPLCLRQERVRRDRRWTAAQFSERENLQLPLDKKREMSDYIVNNTADADDVRRQIREVISRILA